MAKLYQFDPVARKLQPARTQPSQANQHERQSWVRQFERGKGIMALARQNKIPMRMVEQEIRSALWERGAAA